MSLLYAGLVVLLAAALLWQWPAPLTRRVIAFGAAAAIILALALDSLGAPKPAWAEWRDGELLVVAAEFDPGQAIYIWTRGDPPISYKLPWDENEARQIQEGLRGAKESGMPGVIVDLRAGYAEREYHLPPIRIPPEKP